MIDLTQEDKRNKEYVAGWSILKKLSVNDLEENVYDVESEEFKTNSDVNQDSAVSSLPDELMNRCVGILSTAISLAKTNFNETDINHKTTISELANGVKTSSTQSRLKLWV